MGPGHKHTTAGHREVPANQIRRIQSNPATSGRVGEPQGKAPAIESQGCGLAVLGGTGGGVRGAASRYMGAPGAGTSPPPTISRASGRVGRAAPGSMGQNIPQNRDKYEVYRAGGLPALVSRLGFAPRGPFRRGRAQEDPGGPRRGGADRLAAASPGCPAGCERGPWMSHSRLGASRTGELDEPLAGRWRRGRAPRPAEAKGRPGPRPRADPATSARPRPRGHSPHIITTRATGSTRITHQAEAKGRSSYRLVVPRWCPRNMPAIEVAAPQRFITGQYVIVNHR